MTASATSENTAAVGIETNATIRAYNALIGDKVAKRPVVRRTKYEFVPTLGKDKTPVAVYSYNCLESLYRKSPPVFPTSARGLFVVEKGREGSNEWKIVLRGYDKFFNVNEIPATTWSHLEKETQGPYEATLKENGCIIFAGALNGDLIVSSKHALKSVRTPGSDAADEKPAHAEKGEEWVIKHLKAAGKTRQDFVKFLEANDVTAVFELADDDFEEHILEYPPDRRGLYLHGINENTSTFKTWKSERLAPVIREFGFRPVEVKVFDRIEDVREFTDSCRTTGSYMGRAIEGFVVRCRTVGPEPSIYFFKIKYDEPYLMFREWRELTNRALTGKEFKFKPRYELTHSYKAWVVRKIAESPEFFAEYKKQKGIIAARNLFLNDVGLDTVGDHIVAEARRTTAEFASGEATMKTEEEIEEEESKQVYTGGRKDKKHNGKPAPQSTSDEKPVRAETGTAVKTLIIPIATIGVGKTLLGRMLTQLYPRQFGHVQNDNITAKRAPAMYEKSVLGSFGGGSEYVYADKNHHMFMHRAGITNAFKDRYPSGKVVALDWQVEKLVREKGAEKVVEITAERVEQRGENHQSLTPQRTANFRSVIRNFTRNRNALDRNVKADSLIDQIVPLNILDTPTQTLQKVITALNLSPPSDAAIQKALAAATDYKETVVKTVKDTSNKRRIRYYGIKLDTSSCDMSAVLTSLFAKQPPATQQMWTRLNENHRLAKKTGFHVTLCMVRKEAESADDKKAAELSERYAARIADHVKAHPDAEGGEQTGPGVPVTVTLSEVVWDERVMAVVVDKLPDGVQSVNKVPHVTVATASEEIKPYISNEVLAVAFKKGNEGKGKEEAASAPVRRLSFDAPIQVTGVLCGFYH
ncbi:RNA ligase-domain-containing protein [Fimicolochytrium jonesii]|uniref:RNA ligase-domain-containing protein n=1 Tax=Fimicolochytrium jonesii TaxID=1396493 RepID=UPI0022FE7ED1|nr:RNA ligase-domain-containing protein [Fimicolochytrium jonesii]KAI8818596.1 RNA ligase-domain-containing protein [Fimicolochytrium jonesii]